MEQVRVNLCSGFRLEMTIRINMSSASVKRPGVGTRKPRSAESVSKTAERNKAAFTVCVWLLEEGEWYVSALFEYAAEHSMQEVISYSTKE
jgi:hypothetical protein